MTKRLALLTALLLAPLAAPAAPAGEAEKLTFEPSGWLVLNTYANSGTLNAVDLPRWAGPSGDDEQPFGMSVRQSRLRFNMGIPTDGLLAGAKLKGLLELDFMGGIVGNDPSLPIVRLRHAWVSSTWSQAGNLSLLVGQTWGIVGGPHFAQSLSHLAMPRFAGAGYLFRRAPQVRLSGTVGADVGVGYTLGVLAPMDRETQTGVTGAAGERAGLPNLEARVAGFFRRGGKPLAEVGLSTHLGREKYTFPAAEAVYATSRALALDARLDLPYVQLVGGGFAGENLDILYSVNGKGTVIDATAGTVKNVKTRGLWAQALVTPVAGTTLLAGAGVENPDDATLDLAATPAPITRNVQGSVGVIQNLTSRWRIALEGTRYVTTQAVSPTERDTFTANQIELSTLLAL